MSNKIYIGIDPDVLASGVAFWYKNDLLPNGRLHISKMPFFKLFDCLKFESERNDQTVKVIIEAGWLNQKSNWHDEKQGVRVSSRIGKNVGANHQVGKLIVEMCEYLGLEYELHKPITSKMKIRQFRMMTKYEGKLDQDMVDASCLVINKV